MPAISVPKEPYWHDKGLYMKPCKGPSQGKGVIRAPYNSVEGAQRYAQGILPGYPKKGQLQWCQTKRPRSQTAMNCTQMWVIDKVVGSNIDAVARAARKKGSNGRPALDKGKDNTTEEEIKRRVSEEVQRLKMCPPAAYWGTIAMISTDDMYALIRQGEATPKDFMDWLNAWPVKDISNNNMTYLGIDMGEMEITKEGIPSLVPEEKEPVEELEPLTEEIFEDCVSNLKVHM
ncbi:hypothetical protein FRC07_005561 [Ceratobasidium sp. 392]|nr:hypothetical protein FRC07_005561 [Ceratobasidium sp. 392]